jgi:hypothetical protein
MPKKRDAKLTLAKLVDLELQLDRDKSADESYLRRRDGEIGEQIGAADLEGRELFLRWLAELQSRSASSDDSPGVKTARILGAINTGLIVLGFILGVVAVVPWLAYDTDRPVNVIFFWSALIGTQIVLLLFWFVAALPRTWLEKIPGVSSIQLFLRAMGRMPPAVLVWISARCSSEVRELLATVRGQSRRMNWLYGRLVTWTVIRSTQFFAVMFAAGAMIAFIAFTYANDPTFGWKSSRLDREDVHAAVQVIALPIRVAGLLNSGEWSEAHPTLQQIAMTRFYSLDERFVKLANVDSSEDLKVWTVWWPFLHMSFIVYGLWGRGVTACIAQFQFQRTLAAVRLDHNEFQKLASRLRRPFIDTRSTDVDVGSSSIDSAADEAPAARFQLEGKPATVLKWPGVELAWSQIEDLLSQRFSANANSVHDVGSLDEIADRAAIEALAAGGSSEAVILMVEAWEPPVADYLDMIRRVRQTVGDAILILVLLYHRGSTGNGIAAAPTDLIIWSMTITAMGDPWLACESLIAAQATADTSESGGQHG